MHATQTNTLNERTTLTKENPRNECKQTQTPAKETKIMYRQTDPTHA
jgi:hypothetical protein